MERWSSLSTGQKLAVTVGVSAGAALLCVCYSRYRTAPRPGEDELRMTIPRHAAELLLGPDGAIIGQLKTQSHAHIAVTADGGGDCQLTLQGSPSQVRQTQVLQDGAALRVKLQFPASSMGRIIGKGGERIREITRTSGAHIECERRAESSTPTRCITVAGTRQQTLLQKAAEEEAAVQRRAAESSTFRSRRKEIIAVKRERERPPEDEETRLRTTEDIPPEDKTAPQENMADCTYNICKFEVPSPDFSFHADEYVDVYVSAVENPEHFWIQILGSRSSQLDKLTTEMSDHYQRQRRGAVPEIQVGDIVAALFHTDRIWYRAEVLGFLKNGNVDLYYVDYGDNWATARENLFPLRSDFLSLPFQAIECCLSGVAPCGGSWSEQALDTFDALSHCAEWKPLLAKISSFPSAGVSRCFQIQLYDPSSDPMLDIGLELIRQGYATERTMSPTKTDEDGSLVSRLLDEVTSLSVRSEPGSLSSRQEDRRRASDGSIEMIRADVDPSLDHQQSAISTPTSCQKSAEDVDSLEQSFSDIRLGDHPPMATSSPSTDPSSQNTSCSTVSSESSGEVSSSTCTASEGQSLVSSSLEDSSIYSPRGCFYYLTEEVSASSSGDVITISSDSEEDSGQPRTGVKKAAIDSDVFLSSSSDLIVIEDEP
ncbi:tudor and KH domain-containing protein isoform X2 [Bufo gargarizans]|uniref:tudor and KH domain-containing protein isoform X2 n=1 Tax=Bufo gargarizans TaxID=30331 RepID=UPI001CF20CC6|nr:tudor and KH domain-containing protein isoform X2 [Bufo gargarizans]